MKILGLTVLTTVLLGIASGASAATFLLSGQFVDSTDRIDITLTVDEQGEPNGVGDTRPTGENIEPNGKTGTDKFAITMSAKVDGTTYDFLEYSPTGSETEGAEILYGEKTVLDDTDNSRDYSFMRFFAQDEEDRQIKYSVDFLSFLKDESADLDFLATGNNVVTLDMLTTYFLNANASPGYKLYSGQGEFRLSDDRRYFNIDSISELSPVPLPATAWLFLSGIFGLTGLRHLRRQKPTAA